MSLSVEKIDNTDKIIADIERKAEKFVTEGGIKAQSEMKRRVPRRSGQLASSIHSETGRDREGFFAETGTNKEYAAHVEYGTGTFNPEGRKTPWVYFDETRQAFVTTSGQKAQAFALPGWQAAVAWVKARAKEAFTI